MNKLIFLVSLIVACVLLVDNSYGALRTQYLYQGTGCPGECFMKSIRNNAAGCNVTDCVPYAAEPTVLSVKYECPTSYPTNPELVVGEVQIYSFTDIDTCNTTSLSRFDIYKTNVCMKSGIIFGPGVKSGKYIGCEKFINYSDDNCQTELSTIDSVVNQCAGGKIYKCATTKSSASMMTFSSFVILALAAIVAAL